MFDIGFSELMVIGVVALIVIGPERLPRVARTAGHLLGRAQRYVNDVKADINREMQLDELKKLQSQLADSARDIETSVRREVDGARHAIELPFKDAVSEVEAVIPFSPPAPAPAADSGAAETAGAGEAAPPSASPDRPAA